MSTYIVTADIGLRVRSEPFIPPRTEKDNKIDLLPYGHEVFVLNKKTDWSRIKYISSSGKNSRGWVMSAYLESRKRFLKKQTPDFKLGVPNFWSDINTKMVRKAILDEFGGGKNKWDLQCTEYVLYKLKQNGINVTWPIRSGRDGGKWGMIFEKFHLYRVSHLPAAGTAMCFTAGISDINSTKTGHIAFVEKVFADGSILISEANMPNMGKYNERKLSPALWRDKHKGKFVYF